MFKHISYKPSKMPYMVYIRVYTWELDFWITDNEAGLDNSIVTK